MKMEEGREREALHAALKAVLLGDDGKRVMFWLMEQCAIYGEAFSGDMYLTGYRLGRQSIGRLLIGAMNEIDGELYPRFLCACAALREEDYKRAKELADE